MRGSWQRLPSQTAALQSSLDTLDDKLPMATMSRLVCSQTQSATNCHTSLATSTIHGQPYVGQALVTESPMQLNPLSNIEYSVKSAGVVILHVIDMMTNANLRRQDKDRSTYYAKSGRHAQRIESIKWRIPLRDTSNEVAGPSVAKRASTFKASSSLRSSQRDGKYFVGCYRRESRHRARVCEAGMQEPY